MAHYTAIFCKAYEPWVGSTSIFQKFGIFVFQLAQMNFLALSNGNRTEWSPIRSVIIGVIKKSDDSAFVYHERLQTELDCTKSYYQLIIKVTISEKRRIAKL